MTDTFRERIGAADFARVIQFGAWLAQHPKRRDICCYLLDNLDQGTEPVDTPNGGPASSADDREHRDGPPSVN